MFSDVIGSQRQEKSLIQNLMEGHDVMLGLFCIRQKLSTANVCNEKWAIGLEQKYKNRKKARRHIGWKNGPTGLRLMLPQIIILFFYGG